jgi:hypothetical protein
VRYAMLLMISLFFELSVKPFLPCEFGKQKPVIVTTPATLTAKQSVRPAPILERLFLQTSLCPTISAGQTFSLTVVIACYKEGFIWRR